MDDTALLSEIARNTKVIAQLLSLSVAREASQRIALIFDSPQKRKAYQASDGIRSARQVAELAGASHPSIGRWWREWRDKGLVEDQGDGRMAAVLDLELFGLAGIFAEGLE